MPEIVLENQSFKYELVESNRRKTIGLVVHPHEGLTVRVPKGTDQVRIDEVIQQKSGWILQKIEEMKEIEPVPRPKEFVSGERFTYIGRNYKLRVIHNEEKSKNGVLLKFYQGKFLAYVPKEGKKEDYQEQIKEKMIEWYMEKAKDKFQDRIDYYSPRVGKVPKDLIVKEYKSRWGQTTEDYRMMFNWRLVMAPMSVIDYVIVHELCHLEINDHSKKFWRFLGSIIVNYEEKAEWLKINGSTLRF